jgi:hypothetical protein
VPGSVELFLTWAAKPGASYSRTWFLPALQQYWVFGTCPSVCRHLYSALAGCWTAPSQQTSTCFASGSDTSLTSRPGAGWRSGGLRLCLLLDPHRLDGPVTVTTLTSTKDANDFEIQDFEAGVSHDGTIVAYLHFKVAFLISKLESLKPCFQIKLLHPGNTQHGSRAST